MFTTTYNNSHKHNLSTDKKSSRVLDPILALALLLCSTTPALAQDLPMTPEQEILADAEAAWMEGTTPLALEILRQGIQDHPDALELQKLRGDILVTTRRPQEALEAYDAVLHKAPDALNALWAKWSTLLRSGQSDQAIEEFQRIAQYDPTNPLVPLRLAQELRKIDRLEESFEWYKKALALGPDLPGWRLAKARAQFDILDGRGARDEVKQVLAMVAPGSPEETAARNLLSVVYGATKERGRRYQYIFSPEGTAAERKEWAAIRADSWRLVEEGRYAEAEPLLRRVIELKPSDYRASHDLGRALMGMDRCQEAVDIFEKMVGLNPSDEVYTDTFYRMGLCLMKLEHWKEALIHFQILHDAALEFELSTKEAPVPGGLTVLDIKKIEQRLKEVREHLPAAELPKDDANERIPLANGSKPEGQSEEELYKKLASKRLEPEDPIFTRASLMGRDADFSLFRHVIPAGRVMRDDLPGGAHEFIPINPGDTFPTTQEEIFLVFGLVTASYDEVALATQCYLETSEITLEQQPLAQDRIVMAMSEQTGYFLLSPPEKGWLPGLYRCGLFVGNTITAYTHTDEVRFRIIEPTPST
ncbi:tetratricopeptide repeat protein [Candidatus Nitronereus thalassa]|uniref:Tetratricopeptide repeat protein n=1 Tax=Candidatus Nitronereus thalassa TaxID=3020898 RepID=A0ABU3KCW7_9BACT|nr:tetratricopeptide repeat protein [Candidatus Nitronereus thalassa]MDT7044286.1 tetratricopeptide repeat protein [Candidatus Nitronereus thalassa]